jgi:Protein of unknown function (DUF1398)
MLPQYPQALKAIGVDRCDSFISDGHSEYFGEASHKVMSSAAREELKIAEVGTGTTSSDEMKRAGLLRDAIRSQCLNVLKAQ